MARDILVTKRIEDGLKLTGFLSSQNFDIGVAAWVKFFEAKVWCLCVGIQANPPDTCSDADRSALLALNYLNLTSIQPSLLKVVSSDNPIDLDLIALQNGYATMVATKLKTRRKIGSLEIRGAYIYPAKLTLTDQNELIHSVLRLLDRTGSASLSLVTFKDGSQIQAVPVGIRLNTPDGVRIDWHDVVTSQNRSVAAHEVVSIFKGRGSIP